MGLISLKWLVAMVILATSIASGFATLHLASKYKKRISMGEAFASGIFIGAALFHLIPDSMGSLTQHHNHYPFLTTIGTAGATFFILWLLERMLTWQLNAFKHVTQVACLLLTLSIHAAIAGLAVGISNSIFLILSIFIAIMAHKAFEMFALVINLRRHLKKHHATRILFFIFSFITPVGILLGASGNAYLPFSADSILTAYINAICAGTFLYIATIHSHHGHHPHTDGYQKYEQILATLLGTGMMGMLAIWI